jgi:hypothetical protein
MNTHCKNCGKPIKIQIFKGEDCCSVDCQKAWEAKGEAFISQFAENIQESVRRGVQRAERINTDLPTVTEDLQRRLNGQSRGW